MGYLVFFSMIAGAIALVTGLLYFGFVVTLIDLIKKQHNTEWKDPATFIAAAIFLSLVATTIIWSVVSEQKMNVQCELRGGIVNESRECVQEIKL